MKRVTTAFLAVLFSVSAQSVNAADRNGLLLGVSIGGGKLGCFGCEGRGAGSVDLRIGRSICQRFAALASIEVLARGDSQGNFSTYSLTGIGQYWMTKRLWAGAGMGVGEMDVEAGLVTVRSGNSFAFTALTGVEVWQRGRFALDLRGRYTRLTKFGSDNTSVGVGFTWY